MLVLTAAAVSGLLLAACGSSTHSTSTGRTSIGEGSKTGPAVAKDAAAALAAAGAVHIHGTATQAAAVGKSSVATIDMQLQDGAAEIRSVSTAYSFHMIVIGTTAYLKADSAPNPLIPPTAARRLAGKWLKLDSSETDANDPPTLAGFAKEIEKPDSGGSYQSKVTSTTLNGRPVVLLTTTGGVKLWVAATGTPYPVQLYVPRDASDSDETSGNLTPAPATATFSGFGKRVPLEAADQRHRRVRPSTARRERASHGAFRGSFLTEGPATRPSTEGRRQAVDCHPPDNQSLVHSVRPTITPVRGTRETFPEVSPSSGVPMSQPTLDQRTGSTITDAFAALVAGLPGKVVLPGDPTWGGRRPSGLGRLGRPAARARSSCAPTRMTSLPPYVSRSPTDTAVAAQPVGHGATVAVNGTILLRTRGPV